MEVKHRKMLLGMPNLIGLLSLFGRLYMVIPRTFSSLHDTGNKLSIRMQKDAPLRRYSQEIAGAIVVDERQCRHRQTVSNIVCFLV